MPEDLCLDPQQPYQKPAVQAATPQSLVCRLQLTSEPGVQAAANLSTKGGDGRDPDSLPDPPRV